MQIDYTENIIVIILPGSPVSGSAKVITDVSIASRLDA